MTPAVDILVQDFLFPVYFLVDCSPEQPSAFTIERDVGPQKTSVKQQT